MAIEVASQAVVLQPVTVPLETFDTFLPNSTITRGIGVSIFDGSIMLTLNGQEKMYTIATHVDDDGETFQLALYNIETAREEFTWAKSDNITWVNVMLQPVTDEKALTRVEHITQNVKSNFDLWRKSGSSLSYADWRTQRAMTLIDASVSADRKKSAQDLLKSIDLIRKHTEDSRRAARVRELEREAKLDQNVSIPLTGEKDWVIPAFVSSGDHADESTAETDSFRDGARQFLQLNDTEIAGQCNIPLPLLKAVRAYAQNPNLVSPIFILTNLYGNRKWADAHLVASNILRKSKPVSLKFLQATNQYMGKVIRVMTQIANKETTLEKSIDEERIAPLSHFAKMLMIEDAEDISPLLSEEVALLSILKKEQAEVYREMVDLK